MTHAHKYISLVRNRPLAKSLEKLRTTQGRVKIKDDTLEWRHFTAPQIRFRHRSVYKRASKDEKCNGDPRSHRSHPLIICPFTARVPLKSQSSWCFHSNEELRSSAHKEPQKCPTSFSLRSSPPLNRSAPTPSPPAQRTQSSKHCLKHATSTKRKIKQQQFLQHADRD